MELEVCFAPRVSFPPPGRLIRPPPLPIHRNMQALQAGKVGGQPLFPKSQDKDANFEAGLFLFPPFLSPTSPLNPLPPLPLPSSWGRG